MKKICVYPGSFDPVTLGHMDIIRRGAALFDQLIVAVIRNPHKQGCFPVEERMEMLRKCCQGLNNVTVDCADGLTVDYVRRAGADVMIRGLRSAADLDAEQQLAQVNAHIAPEIETVFLACRPEHSVVSSTNVREMASYGCSLDGFVPEEVMDMVMNHFKK